MNYKSEVVKLISKHTKLDESTVHSLIEIPPDVEMGDFAFPCFVLAKERKKAPKVIAEELLINIKPTKNINKIEVKGPYLNFFINKSVYNMDVIEKVLAEKNDYGKGAKKKETIVIEYPAPNTNKPLHLGHVRNILLGKSVSNILINQGYNVKQVNLNNDRGIHICKSMLAYQKWGNEQNPTKKSDHYVGDFYVLFAKNAAKNEKLELEAYDMLRKWEDGDKEVRKLWKKMNKWALDGFKETYKKFGIKYDKVYNESDIYQGGKDIIEKALKKGVVEKDEQGNYIMNLEQEKLPNKVLMRADGTSVYITQDINLAKIRQEDFKMDRMIYVVGSEQNLAFKQLFTVLKKLGFKHTEGFKHLSYGLIYLPEGKMKSREGKVVDADNIIEEMVDMAEKAINERHNDLPSKEVNLRAWKIGMGALKFFVLKYDPSKDFVFNPEESISFEGETGPYIQYAIARINSILSKCPEIPKPDYSKLKSKEAIRLIQNMAQYPKKLEEAAENYKPSLIARHILELAQTFNEYYHNKQILKSDETILGARIALILAVKQVLRNGLDILGIESLDRM